MKLHQIELTLNAKYGNYERLDVMKNTNNMLQRMFEIIFNVKQGETS